MLVGFYALVFGGGCQASGADKKHHETLIFQRTCTTVRSQIAENTRTASASSFPEDSTARVKFSQKSRKPASSVCEIRPLAASPRRPECGGRGEKKKMRLLGERAAQRVNAVNMKAARGGAGAKREVVAQF